MKILNSFFNGYFKQKNAETGRSMVEMLGVLMLMGFLSVGGILAFRYVMTTYQAGEIQDAAAQAKVLMTSRQVRTLDSLKKFLNKTALKTYEIQVEIQDVRNERYEYASYRIHKIILKNMSSNLQQAIYARKDNFAKMDIMISPDEQIETDQSLGSWLYAGMKEDSYEVFDDSGLTNPSPSNEITISFIRKIRVKGEGNVPSSGLLPAECPADMPYYDDLTDSCLKCNPEENAHWQASTQSCVVCHEPQTVWDNVTQKCECPFGLYGNNCEPCDSPKEWRENACQCPLSAPIGFETETCNCPINKDVINGVCQEVCPSNTGLTGVRDLTTNICQCDTSAGYKADSVNDKCVCDTSRDYYSKGDGGCIKCYQVTKAFAQSMWGSDDTLGLNIDSVDETVWYCGFNRRDTSDNRPRFYNPSTATYCDKFEVLRKDGGQFVCSGCGGAGNGWGGSGDKYLDLGICACAFHSSWIEEEDRCVAPCAVSYYYLNGQCTKCPETTWTTDGTACYGTNCDGGTSVTAGDYQFTYRTWLKNVPEHCKVNASDGVSGRAFQSLDPNSDCYYRKGCSLVRGNLAPCTFGQLITSSCSCSTGGTKYCCATTDYETETGCVTCSDGQVPNDTNDGCIACTDNTIAKDGQCVPCEEGYYPNTTHVRCLEE